ncbi:unnamed protein product [Angiostrongylus costaricensis]|uniref:G_PROTEIN_RECEP_F1_2 domain-containing protein n=1 Tax=Angiostrongylus costaricensis TaxID=334426 RepID=A0A0R3PIC2_ANGCS|nr:unnamed protein product [Angiostrongylus costaricensis]
MVYNDVIPCHWKSNRQLINELWLTFIGAIISSISLSFSFLFLRVSVLSGDCYVSGSVFFELELHTLPQCPSFANLRLDLSEITRRAEASVIYRMFSYFSESYKTIWMFWCRNVLNVFLPFSLLLLLNTATISNLNKHPGDFLIQVSVEILQNEGEGEILFLLIISFKWFQLPLRIVGSGPDTSARFKKKDATRTLAALVTVYLLTNTLNLILTIMEFINPELLREPWLYTGCGTVSQMRVFGSCTRRLPYYSEIRACLVEFHLIPPR